MSRFWEKKTLQQLGVVFPVPLFPNSLTMRGVNAISSLESNNPKKGGVETRKITKGFKQPTSQSLGGD